MPPRNQGAGIGKNVQGPKPAADNNRVSPEQHDEPGSPVEQEAVPHLFEHVGDMVCSLDLDGRFTWLNRAGERLTGYRAEELLGRLAVEVIAPEFQEQAVRKFRERLRGEGGHPAVESVLVRQDGARVPVEVTPVVLSDGDRPVAVLGLVRDLSSAEALLQSEERFRSAFRFAAIGMAMVAPDGRFLQVNDALCSIVGYSQKEMLTKTFQDITHPLDLEVDLEYVRQLLAGETITYQMEKRYYHKRGHIVWVLLSVSLVRGSDRSPVHFISQIQDITERKEAEARLRQLEVRYRTLVEQLPLATYVRPIDMTLPNIYASPQIEPLLGYSQDEWHANAELLETIIHPDDRNRVIGGSDELRKTGKPFKGEYRCFHRDGHIVWVQDETYLVLDERGEPCVQGYLLDISERKRAEEERDRLRDELHHAQKLEAIGQLAGGIAHDFNNTLTAIRGYADLLAASVADDETLRRYTEEIRKTVEAGAALPKQLLAFGRRQPLEVTTLRVNEVVGASCELLRPLLGEQIELVFTPGPDLSVVSDRAQLGQALLNLALNARDAMLERGRLTIATRAERLSKAMAERHQAAAGATYAVVSVQDTGVGMDAETRQRVFEPFFTTKDEGTGLGLATLYGIVRQSGGFVALESELGSGSTFELYLPSASEVEGKALPAETPRGTVLVVEDEEAVRGLVREVLEVAGFRVLEAGSGDEALVALLRSEGPIDALVTDLRMPGMDGIELTERIHVARPGLPTVVISAYADTPVNGEDVTLLAKPFSAGALTSAVEDALRGDHAVATAAPPISVLVADDHPPVLDSVSRALEAKGFQIAGAAADGETAMRWIIDRRPNVALVDIRMSRLSGVEVARRAATLAPETSVVLYTGHGDHELLRQAFDAGARGFVVKDTSLDDVAEILREVADGKIFVDPALADSFVTPEAVRELPSLTPRECEVLKLLAQGMTNDGAAATLSISPETIQTHVRHAMAKLHADTRTAAVATALRLALIA
jgi:PAS domain S-box-containing protein